MEDITSWGLGGIREFLWNICLPWRGQAWRDDGKGDMKVFVVWCNEMKARVNTEEGSFEKAQSIVTSPTPISIHPISPTHFTLDLELVERWTKRKEMVSSTSLLSHFFFLLPPLIKIFTVYNNFSALQRRLWIKSEKISSPLERGSTCMLLFRLTIYLVTCSSTGKESVCNAGDLGSLPGLGRSPGVGIGHPLQYSWASLVG